MNGQQQSVDAAVVQATAATIKRKAAGPSDIPAPLPVFISEGAYFPPDDVDEAAQYLQHNFEVEYDSADSGGGTGLIDD